MQKKHFKNRKLFILTLFTIFLISRGCKIVAEWNKLLTTGRKKKNYQEKEKQNLLIMNPASLRQQLINLTTATGGHKEQTDRYRALLEQILQIPQHEDGIQNELLQQFVEASKYN